MLFAVPVAIAYALVENKTGAPDGSTSAATGSVLTATVSFKQLKTLDEIVAGFGTAKIVEFHHVFLGKQELLTGGYVVPEGESLSQALVNYRRSQIEAFQQMLKHLIEESKRPGHLPQDQEARLLALKPMQDNLQQAQGDSDAGLRIYGIVVQDTGRNLEKIKERQDVARVQIAEKPERPPMPMVPPQINAMSGGGE
ncbi:MAG: hypothetical protein AB1374_12795 [Bacillota bacterium]